MGPPLLAAAAAGASSVPGYVFPAVTLLVGLLTLGGVLMGHKVARVSATELDQRAKREELMRTIRWAAEQITKDPASKMLAVRVLRAVRHSDVYQESDLELLQAILNAPIASLATAYHEAQGEEASDGGS